MRQLMFRVGMLGALAFAWGSSAGARDLNQDLNVVTTIKPVHSIASAVMAGIAEPKLLIDGAASPHTFSLKPSDAKRLAAAQIIFRVSDGLEPFMVKVIRSLPKTAQVVTLENAPGLTLYPMRTGGTFEDHDHSHGAGGKHKHSHARADEKNATDGHLYLDPENAKLIAVYMADALGKTHPAGADRFKANADAFGREMSALITELEAKTKPIAGRPFIVFHDAYQYFERRFGLEAAGSVTVSPEVAPSARRLSRFRRKIGELKAVCVFSEPQFEPRLVSTITEKTDARRGVLDPLGVSIPAGPAHYATMLRNLAADLESCLKG